MGLVQRPVFQDHLVDSAGGDEHEAWHTGLESRLEKLQRAGQVDPKEHAGDTVTAAPPIAWAFPLDSRVDDRIRPPDQFLCGGLVPQRARQPLDSSGLVLEAAAVTPFSVPAAEMMPLIGEMPNKVATEVACCTRDGNPHAELSMADRSDAPARFLTAPDRHSRSARPSGQVGSQTDAAPRGETSPGPGRAVS